MLLNDAKSIKTRSLIFLFIFFFVVLGVIQYFFVRSQLFKAIKDDLNRQADKIINSIYRGGGWTPNIYWESLQEASNFYIFNSEGLIIDVNKFIPDIIAKVRVPNQEIFIGPRTVVNGIGETWRLYGRKLSDGILILGVHDPELISVADQKILSDSVKFGQTIATALGVKVDEVDQDVYFAIIDDFGNLRFVVGGLNIYTDPTFLSQFGEIRTTKNYFILNRALLDTNGHVAGYIMIPYDINLFSQHALNSQLWFSVIIGLASLIFFVIFGFFYWSKTEMSKRAMREAFRNYFSPQVLDSILRDHTKIKLGGEPKEMTILFADIRSFTTLTETLSAKELTDLLGEYFTEMTEEIRKTDGVVDKFIGDAIMAFWGAPVDQSDQADRALQSAIGMIKVLKTLNEKWATRGYPKIDIGIGINTGVVTVGNMGSVQRFDYTVIGDDVNVASRLERLNKEFLSNIILSGATHNILLNQVPLEPLGEIIVKGKTLPVKIYKVKEEVFN